MRYNHIVSAKFLRRVNRFIAHVELDGKEIVVHVKNTGRCKELLIPGCTVYLERSDNPNRKTQYDLVTVEKLRPGKPPLTVNMDSQAANDIALEWLKKGVLFSPDAAIRREVFYGGSRFDFYVEDGNRKAFVEVKGVTLETDGVAAFPDAPTVRGVKHLRELTASLQDGYEAYVLFVIQMKEISVLHPNDETHKEFGDALRSAASSGVRVLAVDCNVIPGEVVADALIPVEL
ncbi:MAG: DNA/RNA nuclease SfsA [Clostridia bacterium]|nr:DNA/RNA nuclease SfsA [Clostridia bacterium]